MGKARHWKDVLKMLTKGKSDKLSAEGLLEYFQPLHDWLKSVNKNETVIGWTSNKEDLALYQPLTAGKASRLRLELTVLNSVIILYFFLT